MGPHSPQNDDNPQDQMGQPTIGPELETLTLLRDTLDAVELELKRLRSPLGGLFARELAQVLDDLAGVR